jgi:hypothetical protein
MPLLKLAVPNEFIPSAITLIIVMTHLKTKPVHLHTGHSTTDLRELV